MDDRANDTELNLIKKNIFQSKTIEFQIISLKASKKEQSPIYELSCKVSYYTYVYTVYAFRLEHWAVNLSS